MDDFRSRGVKICMLSQTSFISSAHPAQADLPGADCNASRFLTENSSEPQNKILNLLHDLVELNPRLETDNEIERCLHVDCCKIDLNMYMHKKR